MAAINERPITIDKEGVMTLPKAVRTALHITGRAQLTWEVRDGGVFLRRAITIPAEDAWAYRPEEAAAIERARNSPVLPGVTEDDLEAIIASDNPEQAARDLIARKLNA
jgi:bifunctional DNA-binding transcriptional regulator/antitoxin component of YhaV-PrlF toxin-antitoxin module